jgi:hypothetical protein
MHPDENAEYRTRKETQDFDPALADEEGIRPESGQDAEPIALEQEQLDDSVEQMPGHSGSWHTFITP